MSAFTAFVYADNFRDVEGCNSKAAVDAIMEAVIAAAEEMDDHDVTVKVRSGSGHPTIQVQAEDPEDMMTEQDVADMLTSAADDAVANGNWCEE